MDAGLVGRRGHRAAERVDLLDEVALADAADRRVAAHLAERLDECVSSSVAAPMRAAASAASVPAWPPPTTMTSKCRGNCMRPLRGRGPPIVFFAALSRADGVAPRPEHLGVVDAVLEIARADDDEAERA